MRIAPPPFRRVHKKPLQIGMPDLITAITPQKKRKDRVNIHIDGEYRFSLPLWAAADLNPGTPLTAEQISDLKSLDEKDRAYQRAIAYLAHRPRSRLEIIRYLDGKGFADQPIQTAVERLEAHGYLDDAAFARMWIDARRRHRPRGTFGLQYELRQKGISEEIIQDALQDYDEYAAGWSAIAPKLAGWQCLPEMKRRKKICEYLNRRGFSAATCRDICEKAMATA